MGDRFPLLIIPIGLYNVIAAVSALIALMTNGLMFSLTQPFLTLPMPAPGASWFISFGDLLVLGGLICLFFEILKSTGTQNAILMNHAFSMVLLIAALVEFLLLGPFATSTFFLLVVMTVLDVLGGFIITTIGARKDIGF